MIDRVPAGEYDGGMFIDVHTLLAELLGRNSFNMDEFTEINFEAILLCKVGVGIFIRVRPWLSNQDTLDLQVCIFRCSQFSYSLGVKRIKFDNE